MKKIGIVIAIERELEAFLKSNYEIETFDDGAFTCFKTIINHNEVYAVKSGWGLIDAAMTTQYLITKYNVEIILNFGVTGALDPSLKVSDLFYVSKCVTYDFDTSSIVSCHSSCGSIEHLINSPINIPHSSIKFL